MDRKKRKQLRTYVQGEEHARLQEDSIYRRNGIGSIAFLLVAALAYTLGRSPPRNVSTIFKENRVPVPIEQTIGYDNTHFSRLELAVKGGNKTTYYPTTAVKKWDGANYTERSRQTKDLYAVDDPTNTTLTFYFPQQPQLVRIGGKDYSSFIRKTVGSYTTTIPLTEILSSIPPSSDAKKPISQRTEGLEVLIYYKSPSETQTELPQGKIPGHMEDAERYLIHLISNG